MKFLRRGSLKTRLMLLFGLIFNVFVFVMGIGLYAEGKKGMFKEFEIRGQEMLGLVASLSATHYEESDIASLVLMANSLSDTNDVLAIEMYDEKGDVLIQSSDGNFEPLESSGMELFKGLTLHQILEEDETETSEFIRAVYSDSGIKKLGFVRILMDRSELLGMLHSFLLKVLMTGVVVSVLALVATYYVIGAALAALPHLLKALSEITHGNYNTVIDYDQEDELGTIARSIETMAEQISKAHSELSLLSEFPKSNPNPVFRLDRNGIIALANPATSQFFERDVVVGVRVEELIPEMQNIDVQELCQSEMNQSVEVQRKERTIQFVLCGLKKFGVCHAYSFDLTELREKDRQLVQSGKLAALGEMTSGVAHELNNPLQFIKGYNSRLLKKIKDGRLTGDAEHYLTRIDENCERMRKIINHFRNFSRQADEHFEKVEVNGLVESSFVLLQEQLRMKNIEIKKNLNAESIYVFGNSNRLEQVLVNLIGNARDALEDSIEKTLTVSTFIRGEKVGISVRDTGSGIEPEKIEKIFNPFFTTKEVGKGTGLGLSISHGIIREHGGAILCESELGVGTEFRVELNLYQAGAENDVA